MSGIRMMGWLGAVLSLYAVSLFGDEKPVPAKSPAQVSVNALAPMVSSTQMADLETLLSAQIEVVRLRRLPRNFHDVGSLSWSSDGKSLLVDRMRNQSFEIAEIQVPENFPEHGLLPERVLVTSDMSRGQPLHHGSPAWQGRSSRYFVYVTQCPGSRDYKGSRPSNGLHCNLAYGDAQSRRSYPLTHNTYSQARPRGVTSPVFGPQGNFLSWSGLSTQSRPGVPSLMGNRALYVGAFRMVRGLPTLSGIVEIVDPRHGSFYENYGFYPDGKSLLYAASRSNQAWFNMNLFTRELGSQRARCLTIQCGGWNRWASLSPKGHKIVWSSSGNLQNPNLGIGGQRWRQELRTDLWIMNANGEDKRRLTYFNTLDSRDNKFLGMTPYEHCYVGRSAWHPSGRKLAVTVCFGNRRFANSIVVLLDLAELGTVMP